MTSSTSLDLKGAIEKYLNDKWDDSEQETLRSLRYEIATEVVTTALGSSSTPVPPSTLDEYVEIVANGPEFKQGKSGRDYLRKLLEASQHAGYVNGIDEIGELAKLRYINEHYLGSSDEIAPYSNSLEHSYGDNKVLELGDKKATIKIDLPYRVALELVPEPRTINAVLSYFTFGIGAGEDVRATITPEQNSEEIKQTVLEELKRKLMEKPLSISYEVSFDEGIATPRSVVFHQYTPRVSIMLDKLLL